MSERYLFTFHHNGRRSVEFGPYEDERQACEAFQFRYGYWPEPAINRREWTT